MGSPDKYSVMFARFPGLCHGGGEHPTSSDWVTQSNLTAHKSANIDRVYNWWKADTPITMVRNLAVQDAIKKNVDILYMIDADIQPDAYCQTGNGFFERSFEVIRRRYHRRPTCIVAPYCGPAGPQHAYGGIQNIFAFMWRQRVTNDKGGFSLEQYTRDEAANMKGIKPVAAGATGLIAIDMRIFTGFEHPREDKLVGLVHPYFYYEWVKDLPDGGTSFSRKASTEDVTFTRDLSMIYEGCGLGPALFCDWDCWCLHHKVYPVGRPVTNEGEHVSEMFGESYMKYHYPELIPLAEELKRSRDKKDVSEYKVDPIEGFKPQEPDPKTEFVAVNIEDEEKWRKAGEEQVACGTPGNAPIQERRKDADGIP